MSCVTQHGTGPSFSRTTKISYSSLRLPLWRRDSVVIPHTKLRGRPSYHGINTSSRLSASSVADTTAAEDGLSTEASTSGTTELMNWLQNAAAQGLSNVRIIHYPNGERGLVCTKDLKKDEVVLQIPSSQLLVDHSKDEESNSLVFKGALGSVRLGAKLLRERALGAGSKWAPFINTLPQEVPAPLNQFSDEDMSLIEYPHMIASLKAYYDMLSTSYSRISPKAVGNATYDQFCWAMKVVNSRMLGETIQGERAMLYYMAPLIDMGNHGDTRKVLSRGVAPGPQQELEVRDDNVRFVLRASGEKRSSITAVVVARRDVAAGEELKYSYQHAGPNDPFFMHYGFVPHLNPHDFFVVFTGGLHEALIWHFSEFVANAPTPPAELASLSEEDLALRYQRGYEGGVNAVVREMAASTAHTAPPPSAKGRRKNKNRHNSNKGFGGGRQQAAAVQRGGAEAAHDDGLEAALKAREVLVVKAGMRAPAELLAAFASLIEPQAPPTAPSALPPPPQFSAAALRHAHLALARRCWGLLATMTPLLPDLALLVMDLDSHGAAGVLADGGDDAPEGHQGHSAAATTANGTSANGSNGAAAAEARAPPYSALADYATLLMRYYEAIRTAFPEHLTSLHLTPSSAPLSRAELCTHLAAQAAPLTTPLTHNQRLALQFRSSKKNGAVGLRAGRPPAGV